LTGNAFKHHPNPAAGQVTITAHLQDGWLEFAVADNGPGIDPSLQGDIFEIFRTLKSRSQVESSGIGLTLVKKLVENRGGTVGLTSAVGAGSTFRFTWPIAHASGAVADQQLRNG
ncbi:MAG TPA: ATP-binding protein, partial [Caldilineaceae bacterium]|nr:ATP-binding protein [Caldilineaceae bacterium]